jgi:hypothetical protein
VACSPQAWASATPFGLIQASLGFEFDPKKREIRLHNPQLPEFLDEVTVRHLPLGASTIDVQLHRDGAKTSVEVLGGRGNAQVCVIYSH